MRYKKLWFTLFAVMLFSFSILGYYGWKVYQVAPPIPKQVITSDGRVLFTEADILEGQNIWESMGGQEVGSIWGHGAYTAPDWTADWLHRELTWILDNWSISQFNKMYNDLSEENKATLRVRLKNEIRTNTYDPKTGNLVISPVRADAIKNITQHYVSLFGNDPAYSKLRSDYAVRENSIKDPARIIKMTEFFFWTSWASAANRPGDVISYTSNWPNEPLIDNVATPPLVVWSVISFVLLLAGIGALTWYHASLRSKSPEENFPENDPLLDLSPTPSMRATLKYFWIVTALFVGQIGLGMLLAHYAVEGSGFYGLPIDKLLPYSVTRTWHLQLAIFWIATAWLATGLFVAPAISEHEPRFQRFGVNFLFVALLIIVVGSLFGQWLAVNQVLDNKVNFWFGHQGFEYVDLGRFWQLFLTVGLFLWLFLLLRAILPAFKKSTKSKSLLLLFLLASTAIPIFYIPGLLWNRQSNITIIEFWRWWVVHLWVEGFFEVFSTAVIALLFTRMGLIEEDTASKSVLFSTSVFLFGGIVGTFHHLYFSGTPIGVIALGATFSALEVVPLVLIGFEGYENLKLSSSKHWVKEYKWPIYFFVAVAFWNLVGAGLFGFFINPPIALYYMQGLNTTSVHAHTALFGVYGILGLGLMLFCLKGLTVQKVWKTKVLAFAFWAINLGLALQVVLSVLPVGFMQAWASVEYGMWYARSADFMQSPSIKTFQWLRVIGDTIFATGALAIGWFVLGLKTGWSLDKERHDN